MASLNFLERNALVRGIREGKSFEEAAKALPLPLQKHPDLAKNWKAWAEAEAKKDDLASPRAVKLDADEFMRMRDEVQRLGALVDRFNSDLSFARATIAEKDKQIEDLTAQVEVLSAPSVKRK